MNSVKTLLRLPFVTLKVDKRNNMKRIGRGKNQFNIVKFMKEKSMNYDHHTKIKKKTHLHNLHLKFKLEKYQTIIYPI